MADFLLSVRAAGEPGDGESITLTDVAGGSPIAAHHEGFDTSPLVQDGVEIDLSEVLGREGLLSGPRLEFVGEALWKRLTPGEIGPALEDRLGDSRIYLDLRSTTLHDYPWELLRHRGFDLFLAARICLGVPQASRSPLAGRPPEPEHPLRVLVVVGNDPADDLLKAEAELLEIEAAAHLKNEEILLKTLLRPKPEEVQQALAGFRPHILHFIGHGGRADDGESPDIRVFAAATGQNDVWTAGRIRNVVRSSPPRLVVLNACSTGTAPSAAASLVEAFLDAGCIAVIGMLGDIRADSSHALSGQFYRSLFEGRSIDEALMSARLTVKNLASGSGSDSIAELRSNWPLPRLTARGDVGEAITVVPPRPGFARRWLTADYVARWDERWSAWRAMDGTTSYLALVTGSANVGKSALLNTIADTGARHGDRVVKVDFGRPSGDSWRDVLARIAQAAAKEHLDGRLAEIVAQPGDSGAVIAEFHAELARTVGDGRLLIVLDGLSEWEENVVDDILLDQLCGPYLNGSDTGSPVKMILATDKAWDVLKGPQGWTPTALGPFTEEEWGRAVTHFEGYWRGQLPPDKHPSLDAWAHATRLSPRTGGFLGLLRDGALNLQRGA
ncbi:CHAT domain-containing protein [Microbacterium sp. ProA8]|uniref:CHAT domain-containing protein n=1 Tax=Microbacterium chionoecetis TaxID=3153754 RepID=UPI00326523B0